MKKALKSIADSWFGYLVGSVFLTGIGGLIGGLLTGAFVGIYAGLAHGDEIVGMTDAQEIASTMMGLLPDWLATGQAYLASIGVWLVALLWFLRKTNKPIWKAIDRRSAGNNFRNLMIGFALGAALNGFCAFAACMFGSISLDFSSFNIAYALILLACVFVQSSAEELVCRGYLYQKLLNKYRRPVVAIVGNAAIFAAFHLLNPGVTVLSIVDIMVCGILFSLLVYYFDSIWMAMAAHTAWNYLQSIVLGLPNSGNVLPYSIFKLDAASARDGLAYTTGFGLEGSIMAILVQVVAIAALIYLIKKNGTRITDIWETQPVMDEADVESKETA